MTASPASPGEEVRIQMTGFQAGSGHQCQGLRDAAWDQYSDGNGTPLLSDTSVTWTFSVGTSQTTPTRVPYGAGFLLTYGLTWFYYTRVTLCFKHLLISSFFLTEKPDIHIPEPLEAGRPTQLTCSLLGTCEVKPLTFSWVGGALDSLNSQTLHSSVLTFPRPQDHGTNLTCQVKCTGSSLTTQRTIWLNVFYAPWNLTIGISFRNVTGKKDLAPLGFIWGTVLYNKTTSSFSILEGEAVRLLCEADSTPPAELSWFRGSPALNATPISSTATLELPRLGTAEEGEFSCRAQHPLGSQHVSFSLSVQRSLPPSSCVTEEQQGSWPLVLILIRKALMVAGFLLTYGLTWLYHMW
ncbi:LOW QUALITY PROTEIN: sialic acid-binding Ig-like lectin 14 [Rhynchonycteris naso]